MYLSISALLLALAGWLSRLECYAVHQKVTGLILSQDTYLGHRFDTQLGCVQKVNEGCFSLTAMPLSPPPLSLSLLSLS